MPLNIHSSIIAALLVTSAFSALAFDFTGPFSNYSCIKDSGRDLAIVQGYTSIGQIDADALNNIKLSNQAGLLTDIYMFPCRGKNATAQVNEMITYFDNAAASYSSGSKYDLTYGTIWLNIEVNPSPGCSWAVKSPAENCAYVNELVTAINNKGRSVGISSSSYMWTNIMGDKNNCQNFTSLPLWYSHIDNDASFDDWSSNKFGGWANPTLKQYSGDSVECGKQMDLSYF